ncbi:MAG TPA: HEPN domain-containing protein [Dehalococcoidia bacterium]|nr:HEPN domain-containing protein [Dehalococcoidia bacterium]
MRDEAGEWRRFAAEDMLAAEVLLETPGLSRLAVFLCHEAIEKALKAIWVERHGTAPQRTHNLLHLVATLELEMEDERLAFLRTLHALLVPSRYPNPFDLPQERARYYVQEARGLFEWLQRLMS